MFLDDRSHTVFMSRPRRTEQNKEVILAKGIDLLCEQGYNGTGLKQILDAVQIPKGSFYHYFDSKEAYAAQVVELYIDRLIEVFDNYLMHSSEDPLAQIKRTYGWMVAEFQRKQCREGCLLGNLAGELGATSPLCQAAMLSAYDKWFQRFVPIIERGQASGQVRQDVDAALLAETFWNAWEGSLLRMKVTGSTATTETTLSVMLDSLFRAN